MPQHRPFTATIRTWARRLKHDGMTLWFACRHADTPLPAKLLCAIVVAYALSPIDLIPDFIPVLGYLDDLILLPCLIWLALKLIPREVITECRTRADEWLEGKTKKPRSLWGGLIMLVTWGMLGWFVWRWVTGG